jgi:hypothetical protein
MDDEVDNSAWEEVPPPKPTGRTYSFDVRLLTGMLFAWNRDTEQPVLLRVPASPHDYLPVFHSPHLLEEAMEKSGAIFHSVKKIENGQEFYDSILESSKRKRGVESGELKVIKDLQFLSDGRVRFIELKEN